jgi:hypothetical protein
MKQNYTRRQKKTVAEEIAAYNKRCKDYVHTVVDTM